jgi:acetyl-CoA carboxylase carboxyltransferase component
VEFPKISEIKETLNQVNALLQGLDEKKLNTVKAIIADVVKLQALGGSQGLASFAGVMHMISDVPQEKLDKVASIVSDISDTSVNIQKLVKLLPPEALKEFPAKELVEEVKKAVMGTK